MNKSAYKRHAGKGKSIADRLRENGVISMSPKWKKWAMGLRRFDGICFHWSKNGC